MEVQSAGLKGKRVLALAPVGGYGGFNTSLQRIHALERLGAHVDVVDTSRTRLRGVEKFEYRFRNWLFRSGLPVCLPDSIDVNARLGHHRQTTGYDMLWIDKGLLVDKESLIDFRKSQPQCRIVGYSPDDMGSRHNQSQQYLEHVPLYDLFITTKSYNVKELESLGCGNVRFIGNGYDPEVFRPMDLSTVDRERLGADVGFIGTYEHPRATAIRHIGEQGIQVRVWGGSWRPMGKPPSSVRLEHAHLYGDDYARACGACKINLCFLRKANRDRQTTRSVEIPACGGFMMAERTEEHVALFAEGKEAEFFDSTEELLDKCRFYLKNDSLRERIARNGLRRCVASGYSNEARLEKVLQGIVN